MPLTGPYIVISGEMSLYITQNGNRNIYTTFHSVDLAGYLPYSKAKTAAGYGKALGKLQLLSLPTATAPFPERERTQEKTFFTLTQKRIRHFSC